MDTDEIASCSDEFVARLGAAELHEAMTVLVLVAARLAHVNSVTLVDVGVMFIAGVNSGSEFLTREVH